MHLNSINKNLTNLALRVLYLISCLLAIYRVEEEDIEKMSI